MVRNPAEPMAVSVTGGAVTAKEATSVSPAKPVGPAPGVARVVATGVVVDVAVGVGPGSIGGGGFVRLAMAMAPISSSTNE